MLRYLFFYIFITTFLYSCTPFDSDQHNKKLLQAKWEQVEIAYPNESGDSLVVEIPEGLTMLTFVGDSCLEQMVDIDKSQLYSFEIKDYVLKLEKDSSSINYLDIRKLTKDSLILHSNYRLWKYIKKAD